MRGSRIFSPGLVKKRRRVTRKKRKEKKEKDLLNLTLAQSNGTGSAGRMVDRNDDLTGISYPEQHVNLSRLDRRRITPWHMEQSCLGSSSTGSLVESHASTSTFQSTLPNLRSPERNDSKRTKLGHFRSAMAHRIHLLPAPELQSGGECLN